MAIEKVSVVDATVVRESDNRRAVRKEQTTRANLDKLKFHYG